jgi:hypothetical protein
MKLKRTRLSPQEAELLKLLIRPNDKRGFARYSLNEIQIEEIRNFRNAGVLQSCSNLEVDPTTVKHLWMKTKEESLFVKNPLYKEQEIKDYEKLRNDLIKDLKAHSPKYPKIKRKKTDNGHLLIIDIADLHINKYATSELTGAEYNSKIAVDRAITGTKGLLQKASGFDIDKILFVIGNDVLNTDNLTKSTTKNTPQDTDVSWFEAFKIAKNCYVECIELCLSIADVDVIHCPSNHDFMSGCLLAETVSTHFRLSKNITFNTSPAYRKFYQYHGNMIELEHGDKGKASELPLLMAQIEPKMWYNTKFRYSYLHHVHHSDKRQYQSSKDYIGVNVTYLRSPSSADIWHSDNSYLNMVAVEGFLHSKAHGRICHLTHYF